MYLAYDVPLTNYPALIQEGFIVLMSCVTLILGLYAFVNVIIKHELYRTRLLLAYYIVVFVLLAFRLTTYIMILLSQVGLARTDLLCDGPLLTTLFSDIPSYLYIYAGLCQMFIVIQIVALWKLIYFKGSKHESVSNTGSSINSSTENKNQRRLEQTLKQLKQFKCSVICLFSVLAAFVLLLCTATIVLEIKLKNDPKKTFFAQKELQLFLSILFNLAMLFALIYVLRNFFAMLRTVGMQSRIKFLKVMLIVLALSFLLRAVLVGTLIYLYELHTREQWSALCTLLVTCYLLLGELVPIAFVFCYHIYSGPQFGSDESKPAKAVMRGTHRETENF